MLRYDILPRHPRYVDDALAADRPLRTYPGIFLLYLQVPKRNRVSTYLTVPPLIQWTNPLVALQM